VWGMQHQPHYHEDDHALFKSKIDKMKIMTEKIAVGLKDAEENHFMMSLEEYLALQKGPGEKKRGGKKRKRGAGVTLTITTTLTMSLTITLSSIIQGGSVGNSMNSKTTVSRSLSTTQKKKPSMTDHVDALLDMYGGEVAIEVVKQRIRQKDIIELQCNLKKLEETHLRNAETTYAESCIAMTTYGNTHPIDCR
jgi:hypothetical protein